MVLESWGTNLNCNNLVLFLSGVYFKARFLGIVMAAINFESVIISKL